MKTRLPIAGGCPFSIRIAQSKFGFVIGFVPEQNKMSVNSTTLALQQLYFTSRHRKDGIKDTQARFNPSRFTHHAHHVDLSP